MHYKIKLTEPLTNEERVEIQQICQNIDEQRLECIDLANESASDVYLYGVAHKLQLGWDILHHLLVADRELAGNSDNVVAFGQK